MNMKAPFVINEALITKDIYGNPLQPKKIVAMKKGKSKSEKIYLLLFTAKSNDSGETETMWIKEQGQANARETIIEYLDQIEIDSSYVLVEDVSFGEGCPTVYEFMKLIEKNYNDGFSIDEFLIQKAYDTEDKLDDEERRYLHSGDVPEPVMRQQQEDLLRDKILKEV